MASVRDRSAEADLLQSLEQRFAAVSVGDKGRSRGPDVLFTPVDREDRYKVKKQHRYRRVAGDSAGEGVYEFAGSRWGWR